MSNKLQDTALSNESVVSHSSKTSYASGARGNCFDSLLSCFKLTRKEESEENFTDYQHQNCDYIVEKLIVKRVPFDFVAVPADNLESKTDVHDRGIRKPVLVTEANTVYSSATKSGSLDVAEIISSKRTSNKSNGSPMQGTFASFPVTFVPEFPLMKKGLEGLESSDMRSKIEQNVYNLRQVQNIYLGESQDDNISNQLHVEDCHQEHANIKSQINGRLQYNQEIFANEAKVLAESIANIDLSSITVKWKIIVKHHKPKL
ncbi:uncharacterized protein LOC143378398 [Andrena cerasifolii]|uniref:uncharacterized protein LOC143378398 n=1 Tax=Andrena cerasifolii TaxID=2819439 RepID=UPI00403826FF